MEVVEQPFGRGSDVLPLVHILGQDPVRRAQTAGVVLGGGQDASRQAPRIRVDRESRCQSLGPLLQPLYAQELVAQGLLEGISSPPSERGWPLYYCHGL